MILSPFYDPQKTYEENFSQGPFGAFADGLVLKQEGKPQIDFLGQKIFFPFGIPAGPLINGKFVKAALDKGFDLAVYKTVRSRAHNCHPWPNVLAVHINESLTIERSREPLVADDDYQEPLSITNSFGVPSMDVDFWQNDMADCVKYANNGQVVIGSFQGTTMGKNEQSYVNDFVLTARLVKETGAKVLEVNLSCPNEGTANLLCFDLKRTKKIIEAIKNEIGNTSLIIKIAYFTNSQQLMDLIKLVGNIVNGISAINTISAIIVDKEGKQALPGESRLNSGICGSAIKWAGLEMALKLKELRDKLGLKYTIVGVGGVMDNNDFQDYVKIGADAVMSATGSMWDPYLAQEIKKSIKL